jgi:DNA-binding GntR family transcriptional regulator
VATFPQDVHKTKTALALELLRDSIVRGELVSGQHLNLVELSRGLGMSITPVREAIRMLQVEGLVTNQPHRGVRVAAFSVEAADEIYNLRAILESFAVELAVPRLTADDLHRLAVLEHEVQVAHARGDRPSLSKANRDFHFYLYEASRTTYLLEFIQKLWMSSPWDDIFLIPGRAERSIEEHREIMKALLARDAESSARLIRAHILSVKQSNVDHFARTNLDGDLSNSHLLSWAQTS